MFDKNNIDNINDSIESAIDETVDSLKENKHFHMISGVVLTAWLTASIIWYFVLMNKVFNNLMKKDQ